MILLACSALGLAGAVWPGRRRAGPPRSSILALGAGCVVLGAIGLLEHRNARVVKTRWEASARDRLEDRAHTIEEDFRRFLEELSAPLSPARASVEDRSAAFASLAGGGPGIRPIPRGPLRSGRSVAAFPAPGESALGPSR